MATTQVQGARCCTSEGARPLSGPPGWEGHQDGKATREGRWEGHQGGRATRMGGPPGREGHQDGKATREGGWEGHQGGRASRSMTSEHAEADRPPAPSRPACLWDVGPLAPTLRVPVTPMSP